MKFSVDERSQHRFNSSKYTVSELRLLLRGVNENNLLAYSTQMNGVVVRLKVVIRKGHKVIFQMHFGLLLFFPSSSSKPSVFFFNSI